LAAITGKLVKFVMVIGDKRVCKLVCVWVLSSTHTHTWWQRQRFDSIFGA